MNQLILYKTIGVIGLVCISVSMIVKHRTTRDTLGFLGGVCLLTYSIYLGDSIFIALQSVYILVIAVDFINKKFIHPSDSTIC